MQKITSLVLGVMLGAVTSAQAVVVYSEDFEGSGTDVSNFGWQRLYGDFNGPRPVGTSAGLASRAVLAGGDAPTVVSHPVSLPTGQFSLRADGYVHAGNNTAFGLGPGNGFNNTGAYIALNANIWSLDLRGLGVPALVSTGVAAADTVDTHVIFDLSLDTSTNTATATIYDGISKATLGSASSVYDPANFSTLTSIVLQHWVGAGVDFDNIQLGDLPAVPEPASLGLIGLGALLMRRRQSI